VSYIEGPTDFTGDTECANIMDRISDLAGSRIWEIQVPDDVDLARETDGGVLPYVIVRFADPLALSSGRSIAEGEQRQPQRLSFTIIVIGGDADSVRTSLTAVKRRLVDFSPSDSANKIKARGGFSYPNSDTASRPTRFQKAGFFSFTWTPGI
jgi:hypothetical protein